MNRTWLGCLLAACASPSVPPDPPPVDPPPSAPDRCAWNGMPLAAQAFDGHAVAIPDVTGDGAHDWAEYVDGDYRLVAGPWPGTRWATIDIGDAFLTRFATGDLDGDGRRDLVVSHPWEGRIAVFFGPLASGATVTTLAPPLLVHSVQDGLLDLFGLAMVVGDVTGDGVADLVAGAPAEGEEACAGTRDTGVWPGPLAPGELLLADAPRRLAAPSFSCLGNMLQLGERDGVPGAELLVGGKQQVLAHALPLGDAAGTLAGEGYYAVGAADVDGDGRDDLVFEHGAIATAAGEHHELTVPPNTFTRVSALRGWGAGAGVVFESATPALRLLVAGGGPVTELPLLAGGEVQGDVSLGDIDGDGRADLVVGPRWFTCRD